MSEIDEELKEDVKTKEILAEIAKDGFILPAEITSEVKDNSEGDELSEDAQYLGVSVGDFLEEQSPSL
jgi:hypothetical protein